MLQIIVIILALIFMYYILKSKNNWVITIGFFLLFITGVILYLHSYSLKYGVINTTIVSMALASSLANFFANNNVEEIYNIVPSFEIF